MTYMTEGIFEITSKTRINDDTADNLDWAGLAEAFDRLLNNI